MLEIDHAGITVGVRDMKVKAGGGSGRSAGVSPLWREHLAPALRES
jgi:hypothetical protein